MFQKAVADANQLANGSADRTHLAFTFVPAVFSPTPGMTDTW